MPRPLVAFLYTAVGTCVLAWITSGIWLSTQEKAVASRVAAGVFAVLPSAYVSYKHRTWVLALGGLFGFVVYALSLVLFVHYRAGN